MQLLSETCRKQWHGEVVLVQSLHGWHCFLAASERGPPFRKLPGCLNESAQKTLRLEHLTVLGTLGEQTFFSFLRGLSSRVHWLLLPNERYERVVAIFTGYSGRVFHKESWPPASLRCRAVEANCVAVSSCDSVVPG